VAELQIGHFCRSLNGAVLNFGSPLKSP